MRVAGQQNPAPQVLQCGMPHNALHQPLPQPVPAMRLQYEHIAKVSHGGEVTDHSCKSHLRPAPIINAKAQRMVDGSCHNFPWNPLSPIAIRQKLVDHIQVESSGVRTDHELAMSGLDDPVGIGSRPQVDILNWHRRHSGTSMCPGGVPNREGHDFPVVPQQAALAAGVRFEGTPQRLKAAPSTRLESARVKLVPFPVTTEPTA
jgi:hypothetical protein